MSTPSGPHLSPREKEILRAVGSSGIPHKTIARQLGISISTVQTHLERVRQKYAQVGRPIRYPGHYSERVREDSFGRERLGRTLYMQQDVNLVLWSPGGRIPWTSGSGGRTGVVGALEQDDGNLVIYGNGVIWATNKLATGTFEVIPQNDGNLVVYNKLNGTAIWASNTAG